MNKYEKILEKALELCNVSDRDEIIYGNSYLLITDRKIEVIEPKNMIITSKTKGKDKLYGKSIFEK